MSMFTKLYRGETRFDFIGSRRRWYLASLILIVLCVASMVFRGFNVGIDFKGGTQFQVKATSSSITTTSVEAAMTTTGHSADTAAQEVGSGSTRSIIVKTQELSANDLATVQTALAKALNINADANISINEVSSSWGSEITKKAVQGLIVFLIVVFAYITLRFEWKMAVAALVALLHDLVIAAGIYSIVGFELTPSTIVGLLTILGFSLYDTVVVFDKVSENAKDLGATARMTYSEAANLAVNQTLMRSINTSLISLLPVAGLLFVGAGLLGVGTIKDLALILFVGLAIGAYSSLFLATPVLVELKEREPQNRQLTKRVLARRSTAARVGEPVLAGSAGPAPSAGATVVRGKPAPAPKPGGPTGYPAGQDDPSGQEAAMTEPALGPDLAELIASRLRDVPDFPQPGVLFKDIMPLLADPTAFGECIDAFAELPAAFEADLIAGVEARGFVVAAALARAVDAGVVPVRKAGKLPPPTVSASYELEYGSAEIEVPVGLLEGKRVYVVDDVLATGGTLAAAVELLTRAGATVTGVGVLIELSFLHGRPRLAGHDLTSLLVL